MEKLKSGGDERQASNLAGVKNIVHTTNVIEVDYIDANYEHDGDDGFAKRGPKGYNGSKARRIVKPGSTKNGNSQNPSGDLPVGDGNSRNKQGCGVPNNT